MQLRFAELVPPGAAWHWRNRIFASPDGADEELFLKTLGDCCGRTGFRVWAWVLMRNHYHILIETPAANLVEGMGWLQN